MSIGNRDKDRNPDRTVAAHGLPEGMSNKKPADTCRYYVLARSEREFVQWVRLRKKNLQACTYCGTAESMRGVGFSNPEVELVAVGKGRSDWAEGKGQDFWEAGSVLIGKYCIEKRKNDCIRDVVL